MKMIRAIVVNGVGSDKCFIQTDLPDPCFPYTGNLTFSFSAAAGDGYAYVKHHWPDLPVEIVRR